MKTKGLIHCKSVAEVDKNGKEHCFNIKWQVQIWFTIKNNGTCLQRLWEEQRPVYGPHFKEVTPPQTAAPLASKLAWHTLCNWDITRSYPASFRACPGFS